MRSEQGELDALFTYLRIAESPEFQPVFLPKVPLKRRAGLTLIVCSIEGSCPGVGSNEHGDSQARES